MNAAATDGYMHPEDLAKAIEELRIKALFEGELPVSSDEAGPYPPESEQYVLLAIGALEQAQRFATLALYCYRQKR